MKRVLDISSRIMEILLNVLAGISVLLIASFIITMIRTGIPSFFGYRPLHVVSESMEPTIMTGAFVIGKTADTENIRIGGIYAYNNGTFGDKTIMHRILSKTEDGNYIFKGDNNSEPDPISVEPSQIKYEVIWYPDNNTEETEEMR